MDTAMYYKKELYPLQDKVLKILDALKSDFYLTGGTALSRCYFDHRYSDDLDLFVNKDPKFLAKAEKVVSELEGGFSVNVSIRSDELFSIEVDRKLKIDLVNDVAYQVGGTKECLIYSKVDSEINILSNKISAIISREEPKDVVDIWIIVKNNEIDWEKIFVDVSSKAVGIFPPSVARKLDTFPVRLLDKINWVEENKPSLKEFQISIDKIVSDILKTE